MKSEAVVSTQSTWAFPGGLTITQFHPVKVGGEWVFPVNAADAAPTASSEPFVYTYVLSGGVSVVVDGVEVVALGHGLQDNDVVKHDYLGTDRVVRDLMALDGFAEGRVTVGGFRRNCTSLRIEGLTAFVSADLNRIEAAALTA
eukprot:TRINITY_DN485_c0_g1_i3.p1 TRINITY_DN485_c0_g1~~TRINITY_DN485_c0_g1_i3.p1  ORF type:complete len:144 (-),score=8.08 TRINITY_DN485_c0_g1_i3:249-680(-)